MYKFFVMLGDEFRKLQNYNGILQVTSALGATAVHRLTKNMVSIYPNLRLSNLPYLGTMPERPNCKDLPLLACLDVFIIGIQKISRRA